MFQDTESVHSLIHSFNEHFIIAGWISLVTMIVIIIFLPRGITKPLIRMKPFMEKMHPELSENELEEMYKKCHGDGENGMIHGDKHRQNMMNNL